MEAKQNLIARFIQQQDTQFLIPVYQRNYDWKQEHCKQLLVDIKKAGIDSSIHSHFIGSIVYIHHGLSTSSMLTIIDGQQRLTTLTILIIVLTHKAIEMGNQRLADELTKKYLLNEFMDDEEKLKLKPIKKDNFALKLILNNSTNDFGEYSRIIENYNYFYSNISLDEVEVVRNGFQKLVFIEIGLENGKDDPQKIFQSLNSTGLDLSQADLIRNYILMGLNHKAQHRIYDNYWIEIEQNTTESNSKNNRMSDFIRDYLTFKFSSIPNQNKVFEVFKEKCTFSSEQDLIDLLEDIKLYSKCYKLFINPEYENNIKIRENLKLIKKLQINVSYPFLLQVFKVYFENLINSEAVVSILEIVQSFVWRRFICGLATNALNKIFMDLFKSLDPNDLINSLLLTLIKKKGYHRFPNNEDIISELSTKDMYNIQPKNRTYFLERLENYGYRISIQIDNNDEISIEHILPKNPNRTWKETLSDEYEEMILLVNTAPNLTLSAFNSDLSNSSFLTKRDLPEKGYRYSPLRMDKLLSSFDEWNLTNYKIRQKWILDRFFEIWKYPDIVIEDDYDFDEINILDIDPNDVVYKSIDYFIFFDVKYENQSWTDLLNKVATIMFELEPEQFLSSELGNKIKLTSNENNLLRPLKISNTYFIEANLGSKDIVKRIQ